MKSPAQMKIIQIDITNACTKRCSNCTRFCGHHREPFFMDFETFKRAVDSMKGFPGIVGIMGGEATIHPEFEKFVTYYRENIGYDDFSTACYRPTANFLNHILANAYNVNYSNHRGLWTNVSPKYYQYFELIQDTFGYQLVNDHSNPSMHETLMTTRKELGIPDDEWIKLRDKCWIQNLWSASITPKGAFFCEVAAAMDATLGGPGGWEIEPGWWKRTPADFKDQLHWCEMCSAALPMPKRDAREEIDDVSPAWREKLDKIGSPKLKKGLVQEFDPKAYESGRHNVISEVTPYMKDQTQRIGAAQKVLQPQEILTVAWLTNPFQGDRATRLIESMNARCRPDFVVSSDEAHREVANELQVPFIKALSDSGAEVLSEIKRQSANDWILVMRDSVPSAATLQFLHTCVFNPGCLYSHDANSECWQFFNVRASSLQKGFNFFAVNAVYPKRKIVRVKSNDPASYHLSSIQTFYRRAIKRIYWMEKRIGRKVENLTRSSNAVKS